MSVDKTKVEQAFELLEQANALFQSAGIEPNAVDGEDVVYTIHNLIEGTVNEIEEVLGDIGYYD